MATEVLTNLDMNNNAVIYGLFVVPSGTSPTSPSAGMLFHDGASVLQVYTGTTWLTINPIVSLPVKVTQGGTGASAADAARSSLGVATPAKGDIVVGSGSSATAVVNVGAHNTILAAASGAAAGVSWVAPDSLPQTVSSISASTYNIAASDVGKLLVFTASTAVTVSIPSALALTAGSRVDLLRSGAGTVTVSAGNANVSVDATPGKILRAQYSAATILKHNTTAESYVVVGDLTA